MKSAKLKEGKLSRQLLHELLRTCDPSELDRLIAEMNLIPQHVEYRSYDNRRSL